MSAEDWINLSEKLENGSHITLTGGEPLAFRGFKEVFQHISGRHTINIICNGVLLNHDLADLFCSTPNMKVLSISVDTVGNYNRGVKPSDYQRMKETLSYLAKKREIFNSDLIIDTKTVVTDLDSHNLFEIYKHCVEDLYSDSHSFQFFKGSPIQHSDKMFEYESIFEKPDPYEYTTIDCIAKEFDKIREYCINYKTKCFSHPKFIDFGDRNQNYKELLINFMNKQIFNSDDYMPCKGPWESVHVNADGKIFPCLAIDFGDVRNFSNISEIFEQEIVNSFRSTIRKCGTVQACHRCGYLKLKKD